MKKLVKIFSKMSFMKMISTNFLLLAVLLATLGWSIIHSIESGRERLGEVYLNRVVPAAVLQKITPPIRDVGFRMLGFLADQLPAAGSNSKLEETKKELPELWKQYLESGNKKQDISDLITKVESGIKNFQTFSEHLSAAYTAKDKEKIASLFENEWPDVQANLISPIQKLISEEEAQIKTTYEQALFLEKKDTRQAYFLLASGIGILCIGFILIFRIGRNLRTFGQKTENIVEESYSLHDLSKRLIEMARQLAKASQEQSASYELTSSAMEEMTQIIKSNISVVNESVQAGSRCETATAKGQTAALRMTESIGKMSENNSRIVNQVEDSNRQISDIIKIIQEIGDKTKIINDIVFQTKLLSFNASVEAARAGEHGKGFAIVAGEIGNLAKLSGTAADEISKMLAQNTTRVREIIDQTGSQISQLIQVASKELELGNSVAKECHLSLEEIGSNVAEMSQALQQMTTATHEQSKAVEDVNRSILEVTDLTKANADRAQSVSTEAGELSQKSDTMLGLVASLDTLIKGHSEESHPDNGDGHHAHSPSAAEKQNDSSLPMAS